MKTRREFLLSIPLFLIACTTEKRKMTDEEIKKLQEDAAKYHQEMDKHMLSEGHPIAVQFKYTQNGLSASAMLNKATRNGIPAEQQICSNCMYYKPIGDDYGSCQMLPMGNVTANGWCFSWAKPQNFQMPTG